MIRKGTRVVLEGLVVKRSGRVTEVIRWDRTEYRVLLDEGRTVTCYASQLQREDDENGG